MTPLKLQVEDLLNVIPQLSERDQGFAKSLCSQFLRKGLSANQAGWVPKLIERARNPQAAPETVEVGSLQPIIALLERAAKHLKFPAILVLANGESLRLSVAGNNAKVPGSVNVCSIGGYHDRAWYGRVGRDGKFEPSQRFDTKTQTAVAVALKALATDPAGAAAAYGHLTGVCCFCGTSLTDERSTEVGYGQTCAKHYGMPWGKAARDVAAGDNWAFTEHRSLAEVA